MNEVETTLTEDEVVRAQRLFGKISSKTMLIYALVAAGLIIVAFVGGHMARFISLSALIGGALGHYVVAGVINPWVARKNYRKYPLIQKPFFIKAELQGVSFRAEDGASLIKWENIHKWRENGEFILIYPAPNIYHVIPKRLSSSGLEIGAISKALAENVGSAT